MAVTFLGCLGLLLVFFYSAPSASRIISLCQWKKETCFGPMLAKGAYITCYDEFNITVQCVYPNAFCCEKDSGDGQYCCYDLYVYQKWWFWIIIILLLLFSFTGGIVLWHKLKDRRNRNTRYIYSLLHGPETSTSGRQISYGTNAST